MLHWLEKTTIYLRHKYQTKGLKGWSSVLLQNRECWCQIIIGFIRQMSYLHAWQKCSFCFKPLKAQIKIFKSFFNRRFDFHSPAHRAPSLAQQHIHNIPAHMKISPKIYPTLNNLKTKQLYPHQSSCFLRLNHVVPSHKYQPRQHSWCPKY